MANQYTTDYSPVQIGDRVGQLLVLAEAPPEIPLRGRNLLWLCVCDCGTFCCKKRSILNRHITQSCGCLTTETTRRRSTTHGATRGGKETAEHRAWQAMKTRVTNPKQKAYSNYGGRGITICERWLASFEDFLSDIVHEIGPHPGKGYSLDRVDNNGNYEPGNVRWATWVTQGNNTRKNYRVTYHGRTLTVSQWARELGVPPLSLWKRLAKFGWSPEEALTTPYRKMVKRDVLNRHK